MEETKEQSLKEKLDVIINKLSKDEEEHKKKFNLPFMMRLFGNGQVKKGFAVVFFVRTNGKVEIKMVKIDNDTVKIGEAIYAASANYVLRWKKFPFLIIPEWTMLPFSPEDSFKKAYDEGTLTAPQVVIASRMKSDQIKPKMNFNISTIVIIVAAIGGIYFLLKWLKVF